MDLPRDIILDVLTRLPVKSLSEMRCTSKTSLNIIDNPFFATLHTSRLLNSAVNSTTAGEVQLMLLAHSWSSRDNKFLTALQSLKYNDKNGLTKTRGCRANILSGVGDYNVDFVFCNLICLKQLTGAFKAPCLLINPLRGGEFLELPINDLIPPYARRWYGIGFDSITSTHKIVGVFKSMLHKHQVAYVYTLGTRSSSWREIHSVPQCEFSRKNVFAYGDMHWLVYNDVAGRNPNRIISFDSKKDEFVSTPYPNSSQGFIRGLLVIHLLNLRGCLAIVSSGNLFVEIWVLKNYEKKEWALDYKIDNEMLPNGSPLNSIESCGELEHGIFFTEMKDPLMFYFWDIRYKSIKYITGAKLFPDMFSYDNLYYHLWGRRRQWRPFISIFSCTRGLISLKTYGNLVERRVCRWTIFEAAKTRTWHFD
ncbi:PREDICTED: F-box protein At1g52490-like [Prunus mume]|uniref:F-box protein At1g52490-like n=1 Tax=Prunus mume TaxID=102107 RepID=A0ABM0PNY5_PRUMU|nr:PREDICTED: F-box protein At1g52490-like [Prunus mume]